MPKVSIIVPVFNVENYVSKCIESLIFQTFKDLEIVIINDGSTDKTKEICEEYSKKDPRILLISQKNAGVSAARNLGLDRALGNFVMFVDGDDFLELDAVEFMLKKIEEHGADISTCGLQEVIVNDHGEYRNLNVCKKNGCGVICAKEALKEVLISRKVSLIACCKLYKKELFDDIKFPVGVIYEDSAIVPLILTKIKSLYYDSEIKYYYVRHLNSITNSRFSNKDLDIIRVNKKNYDMVKNNYKYAIDQAEFRYFWSYLCVIDKIVSSGVQCDNLKKLRDFVKKNKWNIFKNKYFTFKRKMITLLMIVNLNFYKKILIHFYKKRNNFVNN